jgi:hypothetical protein
MTHDVEQIVAKAEDVRIWKFHDPERKTIDFAQVYARVANGTVIVGTHDLSAHPAEAERPQVDDRAGHLESIDEPVADLQDWLVCAEALQPCGGECWNVDVVIDWCDKHARAADVIGRQREFDLAVLNFGAVKELPLSVEDVSCERLFEVGALPSGDLELNAPFRS